MKNFLNKHVVPTLWYVGIGLLVVLFILSAVEQSKTESTSDVFYGLLSENNLRMTGGVVCEDSRCDFDVQWSLVEGTR